MRLTAVISTVCLGLVLAAPPAVTQSTTKSSQGSTDFSTASGTIVGGSVEILAGSGQLIVSSVEIIGDSMTIVLRGASDAIQVSVNLSGEIAGGISLAAGTSVQVVTESTGYLLTTAGTAIAFIPNEVGRSLLYHSRYQRRG